MSIFLSFSLNLNFSYKLIFLTNALSFGYDTTTYVFIRQHRCRRAACESSCPRLGLPLSSAGCLWASESSVFSSELMSG